MHKALLITVAIFINLPAWSLEESAFSYQDMERKYLLHNKIIAKDKPAPIVIVLHGYRSEGQQVHGEDKLDNQLFAELDKLAEIENFITIYPTTVRGRWNLFSSDEDKFLTDSGKPIDDVGYINELITLLIDQKIADPSRIYLTGFSDGAILSYRLLCEHDQPFAAAAPLMGSMHQDHHDDCTPEYLPAVLVIAGTLDRILPYDGWIYKSGREVSIPETIEVWRRLHGCQGQTGELIENISTNDLSQAVHRIWTDCNQENAVQLLRIEGGGHQVPSKKPSSERWIEKFGYRNQDFEAANEIWSFFKAFSRQN